MFVWSKLSALQWSDAWEERFTGIAGVTTVITQFVGRKTVRVEVFCERKSDALTIQKGFGGNVREVKKQNWAAMAPEPPEPLKVRNKLVICTAKTDKEIAKFAKQFPGREIIGVPAELAFGTGHHETTSTVLRLLADEAARWNKARRKWTVCDLGCGTGILGIAAAKLGASKVWGCDFDPQAVRVSKENVVRNKVDLVTFAKADVLNWQPKQKYDLVAANIFHDVLNAAFPAILSAVADDGVVLISGILNTQADECLAMGRKAGLVFDQVMTKGKWVTARGMKQ